MTGLHAAEFCWIFHGGFPYYSVMAQFKYLLSAGKFVSRKSRRYTQTISSSNPPQVDEIVVEKLELGICEPGIGGILQKTFSSTVKMPSLGFVTNGKNDLE